MVAPVERLGFSQPEAWAMKYFASTTLLSGLDIPRDSVPGSVTFGVELGQVPELSVEQQRVGFGGTKEEDLNSAPIFLRPRVAVELPWRLSFTVAFAPPVRFFGVTPRLIAAGLERPFYERAEWKLGWRAYGQVGTVQGAFTCPRAALAFPEGSPNNSYGCEAESADVATLRYIGGELSGSRRFTKMGGLTPHAAVAVNYVDSAFQVNAHTFGYLDHTRLETRGTTVSLSTGIGYELTQRFGLAVDLFYSPLEVRRGLGSPLSNDGLLNARALVSYRLR